MRILVVLAAVLLAGCANNAEEERAAEQRAAAFVELSAVIDDAHWRPFVKEDGGVTLPYRLYVPEAASAEAPAPLIVLLHGAGERDGDNLIQLLHGAREMVDYQERRGQPAFIFAPQAPRNASWGGFAPRFQQGPAPHARVALEVIEQLLAEYPIDRSRIYVTGLSMGGYGTFELVARRPDLFAAALPICGGGHPGGASALARTPFWIFHGALDDAVPVQRSREMVAAIEAAGGSVRYTEYPELGHNSWDAAYGDDAVFDWMFAQRRE